MKSRNRVNTYAVRITRLIADIESKYHGPDDTLAQPPLANHDPSKGFLFHFHGDQYYFYSLILRPGKGKEKVGEEQAAQVLLHLQTPKEKIDEALDYRVMKQGLHVRYPETTKDKTYLPESGKLCWWTDSRRRLPEIRLKMNLPDHRSVLTDQEDQAKMEMETPRSSRVNSPPNAHS
ncbi:hypothetical protein Tco_0527897 [Tanacetum coccineum]